MQAAACAQCMQDPCACVSAALESKENDIPVEKAALPEWCHTVQWELLARTPEQIAWCSREDAADDSDGKFVVLPEAANVDPRRRALVTLPSGGTVACIISVLVKFCSVLNDKAADLLSHVVHLHYQPARLWSDHDVLGFFSLLHKFKLNEQTLAHSIVDPAWSALATALGVQEYVEFCQQTIQKALEAGLHEAPTATSTWKWIAAYRQFADEEAWREPCLSNFLPIDCYLFRQYWTAESRPIIAEVFTGNDLFALAYSRWRYFAQGWRLNPSALVGKTVTLVNPKRGDWSVLEYRASDGTHGLRRCQDHHSFGWRDLKKDKFIVDGRTIAPDSRPLLPRRFEWPTSAGQEDATFQAPSQGSVSLHGAESLPPFLQLRLVVDDHLSFHCDFDTLQGLSCLVKEAVIDESGEIPTLYLPFAAGLPRHEVVEFFHMTHNRQPLPKAWKYTWVQLADHLQMDAWLSAIAKWVWGGVAYEHLADWIASSRLQSMQARKPSTLAWSSVDTVTAEGVLKLMQGMDDAQLLRVFSGNGNRFARLVGLDVLFDLFATKQCDPYVRSSFPDA